MQTQSLKAQRAAQKAAKQMKQIQRQVKKPTATVWKLNRAHRAEQINAQKAERNRAQMLLSDQYGAPPTDAERTAAWRENEAAWNELVYCKNLPDHTGRFEKMLRNARVLYSLFDYEAYSYFVDVFDAAENALREEFHSRDLSPNQRRAILKPLQDLNDVVYGLMKETPQQVLYAVAKYGTGVQVQAYVLAFWEQGDTATLATLSIMEGYSINAVAKKCGIKVDKLREKILYCARCLYRVAECDNESTALTYPSSIPELRGKAWQKWRDGSVILNAYTYARENLIMPFEIHTGKGMTNGYDKRFQKVKERIFNPKTID